MWSVRDCLWVVPGAFIRDSALMTSQILPLLLVEKGAPDWLVCALGRVRGTDLRQMVGIEFLSLVEAAVPFPGGSSVIAALESCIFFFQ